MTLLPPFQMVGSLDTAQIIAHYPKNHNTAKYRYRNHYEIATILYHQAFERFFSTHSTLGQMAGSKRGILPFRFR